MPKYTLYYFDVQSRGEAIRLIFKLAGVDFVDRRISTAEWPELKKKFATKEMPVLEIEDGVVFAQSKAILRYLAKEFGYYGSNNLDAAYIDEVIDTVHDAWLPIVSFFQAGGENKTQLLKNATEKQIPKVYEKLDALYCLRPGAYFVGDTITAADLHFFGIADALDIYLDCATLEKFPRLSALKSRIAEIPNIAKWLNDRPEPSTSLSLANLDISKF